jgi:hypothetical protein
MNISNALFSKYKGCEWSMNNEDYSTLEWFSDNIPKPTEEELIEEYAAKEYQRQRAPEYPDIKDQLDAIWKGGDAYEEMLARVMEVKTKYPKPE